MGSGLSAAAHHEPPTYDRVAFEVSASEEVDNDTLVVVLYAQREGGDQGKLASEVNEAVGWALERARATQGIKVQTLQYRQSPVYRSQQLAAWRVRQSLRIEGQDVVTISRLVGELQSRLSVESMRYEISPAARKVVEDRLIVQALGAFTERANLIAKELGREQYRIVRIDVNTSGAPPVPIQMRGAMLATEAPSAAPPALAPGEQTVTVQVRGVVEIAVQ